MGAGKCVEGNLGADSENLPQGLRPQHLPGSAVGDNPAGLHEHQTVAESGRLVDVLEDRDHGFARRSHRTGGQGQEVQTVADVEVGGGLIQQQYPGVLGQGAHTWAARSWDCSMKKMWAGWTMMLR